MPSTTPSQPEGLVYSLDPGIITGWAFWRPDGELYAWGNEDMDGIVARIHSTHSSFTDAVYEDYRLRYGRQAPADSHHSASQVIGMAKMVAAYAFTEQRMWPQEVEVLTIESMHLRLERPKSHRDGHYVDAVLHGAYWFRRVGIEPNISRLAAGSTA